MLENLCEHFHCPHYKKDENYCKKYFSLAAPYLVKQCPVFEIRDVAANQYYLSIDIKEAKQNSKDLIRLGIAMATMGMDG